MSLNRADVFPMKMSRRRSGTCRASCGFPAAELYGIQRIEYLDDVLILSGAGVGGGSHVYANTLYVPPKKFFDAPEWAGITDWADELAPYIDQATRMLGAVRYPYMPTDVDRYMLQVANEMGRGETVNKAPVGVYFGRPYVLCKSVSWRDVPAEQVGCSGVTAWRRLRDWTEAGVWPQLHEVLLTELRAAGLLDMDDAAIDGSHIRALKGGLTPDLRQSTGPGPAASTT